MGFNSGFKGLTKHYLAVHSYVKFWVAFLTPSLQTFCLHLIFIVFRRLSPDVLDFLANMNRFDMEGLKVSIVHQLCVCKKYHYLE